MKNPRTNSPQGKTISRIDFLICWNCRANICTAVLLYLFGPADIFLLPFIEMEKQEKRKWQDEAEKPELFKRSRRAGWGSYGCESAGCTF